MRVVLVGGPEMEAIVRRMVGPGAELVPLADSPTGDLVFLDARQMTIRMLTRIRDALPNAPLIVVPAPSQAAERLRLQMTPEDLARLTYKQVSDRFGRDMMPDYFEALLRRHEGNVTKAALAAGLERESLHRLIRRFRVRAGSFRPTGSS